MNSCEKNETNYNAPHHIYHSRKLISLWAHRINGNIFHMNPDVSKIVEFTRINSVEVIVNPNHSLFPRNCSRTANNLDIFWSFNISEFSVWTKWGSCRIIGIYQWRNWISRSATNAVTYFSFDQDRMFLYLEVFDPRRIQ